MNAPETQFPPLAQALGRLRQPRAWPYAARPVDANAATQERPTAPAPRPADNDFLRVLPEPALTGELPPAKPVPARAQERERLTAAEAIALAPLNRTYWFDL